MLTRAVVTGVTRTQHQEAYCDATWAQEQANLLHEQLGTWRNVADVLVPFYRASASAWWQLAMGQKVTRAKVRALRHYRGMTGSKRKPYLRPCLSHEPAKRLAQLARLTAQAQAELEQEEA